MQVLKINESDCSPMVTVTLSIALLEAIGCAVIDNVDEHKSGPILTAEEQALVDFAVQANEIIQCNKGTEM